MALEIGAEVGELDGKRLLVSGEKQEFPSRPGS
jgi:hypothetical protein